MAIVPCFPSSPAVGMDFMKIFDQAVREIKREVNLKVLKVPEIEQKGLRLCSPRRLSNYAFPPQLCHFSSNGKRTANVLDATSDEPWGPHGSSLAEIAQATKKFTECQMIMNVLWTRLTDTGSNWRHALAVIEYLVANGSERAVDDIVERSFRISSLSGFKYVEPNGKDVGLNVRKKVETILALLKDRDKIQEVRNKAAANQDKYFGLSSTGITFKSGSASYSGSSFQHNDGYGGLSGAKGIDTFKMGYKDRDRDGDEIDRNHNRQDVHDKSQDKFSSVTEGTKPKKGTTHLRRDSVQSGGTKTSARHDSLPPKASNAPTEINDSDFDDFNPRGSSTSEFDDFDPRGSSTSNPVVTNFKKVDLFGDSLVSDLMDAPPSSTETVSNTVSAHDIDLFADASFVSALHAEASTGSSMQSQLDLFADQPAAPASFPNVQLLSKSDLSITTETKSPPATEKSTFDPFAAMPLNNPESYVLFGAFTSPSNYTGPEPSQNPGEDILDNQNQSTSLSSKPAPTKGTFQVKSGIWADSLSRGIIDLNLTARKCLLIFSRQMILATDTSRILGEPGEEPRLADIAEVTNWPSGQRIPSRGWHAVCPRRHLGTQPESKRSSSCSQWIRYSATYSERAFVPWELLSLSRPSYSCSNIFGAVCGKLRASSDVGTLASSGNGTRGSGHGNRAGRPQNDRGRSLLGRINTCPDGSAVGRAPLEERHPGDEQKD
ncbi:hypothetical protein Taro_033641 [Colocasia esculenta]|uniref:ENTH domain-containing protein n=1 Tax=Colocasia esculenta TaxID=4460 RepID=A0A843W0P1_COLES|nr:hypothetical protein [Colocasia esculenta]